MAFESAAPHKAWTISPAQLPKDAGPSFQELAGMVVPGNPPRSCYFLVLSPMHLISKPIPRIESLLICFSHLGHYLIWVLGSPKSLVTWWLGSLTLLKARWEQMDENRELHLLFQGRFVRALFESVNICASAGSSGSPRHLKKFCYPASCQCWSQTGISVVWHMTFILWLSTPKIS